MFFIVGAMFMINCVIVLKYVCNLCGCFRNIESNVQIFGNNQYICMLDHYQKEYQENVIPKEPPCEFMKDDPPNIPLDRMDEDDPSNNDHFKLE